MLLFVVIEMTGLVNHIPAGGLYIPHFFNERILKLLLFLVIDTLIETPIGALLLKIGLGG